MGTDDELVVRSLTPDDFSVWSRLYRGYGQFYETEISESTLQTAFAWMLDEAHLQQGRVVERNGELVGLMHYQVHPHPLKATTRLFLNDLFVDPDSRGNGAVDCMLKELIQVARSAGASEVRWLTQENNHRARAVYERYAKTIPFLTYQVVLN